MDKIKILQWNCQGLSNKILKLLVFLKEKNIDIVCLNEVKSWQKENLADDYFVVTETRASKSHGSIILAKKGTTIIEVKPETFDRNERGKINFRNNKIMLWSTCYRSSLGYSTLQITGSRFESIRNFWNWNDKRFFLWRFQCSTSRAELHIWHWKCDKIIETIETGKFKLLNNGYHTYQSLIYISPINQSSNIFTHFMFPMTLVVIIAQPLLPCI